MGSRNRERRKAKQKARADRVREQGRAQAQRHGEQPGQRGGAAGPGEFEDHGGVWGDGLGWANGTAAGPFRRERGQREALRFADQLVATGVKARADEEDAVLADVVSILGSAPGTVGRRVVNRALRGWFDRAIEGAWARGWQPVDLHRIVRRQASGRHTRLVVDAIAAQMRQYAAPTVDERWAGQLDALDAGVWWTDNDAWLDGWGERESRDRGEVLLDALELLAVVHCLPPIETLCPPPGSTRRDPSGPSTARSGAGTGHGTDTRVLDRVRALLAKAESTGFVEEAEALTAKAQQLMARHSIDEALLAAREGSRDRPVGRRIGVDSPYESPKAGLLDVIAVANRCRAVWSKSLGFATVVGFRPDLDAVELLYTSLLVQATTAMTGAGSRQDRHGRSRTRSFRQAFLASFAIRVGQRLTAAAERAGEQAAAEASDDRLLPVLAARSDAVQDTLETMFPQLTTHAISTSSDAEGWASGRAAADLATLHARDEVTTT